jgi:hypothetical protein
MMCPTGQHSWLVKVRKQKSYPNTKDHNPGYAIKDQDGRRMGMKHGRMDYDKQSMQGGQMKSLKIFYPLI